MNDRALASYRQTAARGATPLGQVVALYDAVLRDFFRALAALKAGNVAERVEHLNHAISVIGYLANVLDHEQGGKVARQLAGVYTASIGMIVQANAKASTAAIDELIEIYGDLRQAWYQAEQKLAEQKRAEQKLKEGGLKTP